MAIAAAREQLAKQATRAQQEDAAELPLWVTVANVIGWFVLVLLGVGAVVVGGIAVAVKHGRLSEADLEQLLWR